MRTLIAFGADGGKVLESLVFAACMEPVEPAQLIWVEPDDTLPRLQELLKAYEAARTLTGGEGLAGFQGTFTLKTWSLKDGTASMLDEDPTLLQMLLDRHEAAAHWRSRADRHPNLAALAYGAQLEAAHLPEDAEAPLLIGAVHESWSAAGMVTIARRMKDAGLHPMGVVLLPHRPYTPEEGATAAGTLRLLTEEGLFVRTHLLGMPEGCFTASQGAHLVHWLGARAALSTEEEGVFVLSAREEGFGWADFGASAEQLRRAYRTMLQAAGTLQAEILPLLKERLSAKPRLGQKRVAWYNAYFRQVHKLTEAEGEAQRRLMEALDALSSAYVRWVLEVVASLPPQWQDREAFLAAEQRMAEQYRQLLEAAGQWALMDEEIQRSGMAKEQLVRRGAPRETAADELLRKAEEQLQVLKGLEKQQEALETVAGGAAKKRLLSRMLQGIDRALEKEKAQVDAWKDAAGAQGAQALQMQESIYRLETHMRILEAERARVLADREAMAGRSCKPPKLPDVRPWGNDLFPPELLGQLAKYLTEEDEKERRVQSAALVEACGLLAAMGRESRQDTLLPGLFARLMATTAEEVR